MHLATEDKEHENVDKTIYMIKTGNSFEQNEKALGGASKDDLKRTYAFLLATTVDDPRVAKLKVDGLRAMLMARISELLPQYCTPCGNTRPFYPRRDEVPMVSCRRCRKMACPTCYGEQEKQAAINKWIYLCKNCDDMVSKETGEGRLEPKHVNKVYMKKMSEKKDEPAAGTQEKERASQDMFASQEDAEVEEIVYDEDDEDDNEDPEKNGNFAKDAFILQNNAAKKAAKKERQAERKINDKKNVVCPHMKKGRCFHSMTGRGKYLDVDSCHFLHPRVCQRLLDHGDRGHLGCKAKTSGCRNFHPKMCQASLSGKCQVKDCKHGYHVKSKRVPEKGFENNQNKKNGDRPEPGIPAPANPWDMAGALGRKVPGKPGEGSRTTRGMDGQPMAGEGWRTSQGMDGQSHDMTANFLGQIFMQQQQMQEQQKQQQQILQMLASKLPTMMETRPMTSSTPAPTLSLDQVLRAFSPQ